jgi:hypothetical protein
MENEYKKFDILKNIVIEAHIFFSIYHINKSVVISIENNFERDVEYCTVLPSNSGNNNFIHF